MPRPVVRFALLVPAIVLVTLLAAFGHGRVIAAPSQAGSLRDVNWDAQVTRDFPPANGECFPPPPSSRLGPCVDVPLAQPSVVNGVGGSGPVMGFAGYADTADVLYADLDGDGREEAVIRVESGGTAGALGFLVYHQTALGPQAVVTYPGYKLGVRIDNGLLVVSQPYYFGFEANCCPTGLIVNIYALGDAGLYDAAEPGYFLLGEDGQQPATPAELTVAAFYRALDSRAFDVAYSLINVEGRARKSFDDFKAGYTTTLSVNVIVAPGSGPDEVRVQITSMDSGPGGSTITKHFAGSWFVAYDASAPLGVYLARASIQEMP